MYFLSSVDQLSESKIRGRIESGNYMGMQPGQMKDLIAPVSSHKCGTKNAFGISIEEFIANTAKSKEKYILPFDPTALKFKNDEKATDHYFTKYEDLTFKIAASPNNYI